MRSGCSRSSRRVSPDGITRGRRRAGPLRISLGLTALITPLAVHLFFPVIPAVKVALGLSDARAQLTFSIALFGMAFATLFYGSLSDRYGRRPVLLSGLALFLFGSVRFADGGNRERAGARAADPGDRRRLRADAGTRDRARRLPRRATRQGDRLPDHVRHARTDGLADHRRRADRHARLAQRIRLRARWPAAPSRLPPILRCTRPIRPPSAPKRRERRRKATPRCSAGCASTPSCCTSGFNTGAFMVMASAAASLMTELLHRPATEFGLTSCCFRWGSSPAISSRPASAIAFSTETMVLAGSLLALGDGQRAGGGAVASGWVTPLAFFIPGTFITMAQGIAMPYAQVGAMAEIPRFAGTAAGIGVFMQNFGARGLLAALRRVCRRHAAADDHDRACCAAP